MARIVALADVLDALTTVRPYKRAWSVEEAVSFIESQAGSHFDPALIEPFQRVLPDMLRIREEFSESRGALEDHGLS